jgi:hypothetical protein
MPGDSDKKSGSRFGSGGSDKEIRLGDYVKEVGGEKRKGRVVSGTATDGYKVDFGKKDAESKSKAEIEKTRNTMSGGQFKEILLNGAVFGGIQLFRKENIFGERSIDFLVSDALYEFLLKGVVEDMVPMIRPDGILAADDRKFFASSDFKNGIGKAIPVVLTMQLYSMLMRKHKFSNNIGKNILDSIVALTGSNIIDRKFLSDKKKTYNY